MKNVPSLLASIVHSQWKGLSPLASNLRMSQFNVGIYTCGQFWGLVSLQ